LLSVKQERILEFVDDMQHPNRPTIWKNKAGPISLETLSGNELIFEDMPIPPSGHCKYLVQITKQGARIRKEPKLYEGGKLAKDPPK
jgi:hypothetical protein